MFKSAPIDSIYLHAADNVCVAARDLPAGTRVSAGGRTLSLPAPVKLGHKIALAPVSKGQRVVKYGQTIGFATEDIRPGSGFTRTISTAGQFDRDYAAASEVPPDPAPLVGPHVSRLSAGRRHEPARATTSP